MISRVALGILISCAIPVSAQTSRDDASIFAILSNGQDSCGEFLAGDQQQQLIDVEWVLGFITGQNSKAEGADRLVGRSFAHTEAVSAWIQNYCRSHALDVMPAVADALRSELSRREGGGR